MNFEQDGKSGTLLLYVQVAIYRKDDEYFLENQACNGLKLWADNFDRLIVMLPLIEDTPQPGWVPIDAIGPNITRIEFQPLPKAYKPIKFLKHLSATRRRIADLINRADYLCFAIGGLFGDWGAVSCLEADRLDRQYAVWTDKVESEVTRHSFGQGSYKARLRARLTQQPMAWLEKRIISRATLGLFHGLETFEAYKPICGGVSKLVHNIHISKRDHISSGQLTTKISSASNGPLKICYVGRIAAEKGPLDWIKVIDNLAKASMDFHAVWLGNGPLRSEMMQMIQQSGLGDRVELPGFVDNRAALLEALREANVFLFCHKTPESPRCLIEALISGTPIVGYDSAFPRGLIEANKGGLLVPINDVAALTRKLVSLAADRSRVSQLIEAAARDGAVFDDVSVFQHRSECIKQYLPN